MVLPSVSSPPCAKPAGIWFGWSGETPEQATTLPKVFRSGNITYITLDLDEQDFDLYYGGFANRTLWPLFHYRLDLATFDSDWYSTYRKVNRLFAEQLFPYVRDDDVIWIHDYHLIPMAEELQAARGQGEDRFFPPHPVSGLGGLCHASLA